MKTISIEELHERTTDYVRAAAAEPIVIVEHGRQLAMLSAVRGVDLPGKPFPVRDLATLPKVTVETSSYISENRNGR
jgi:antitoxin (DNA-binding transcriptional repressor) of toxin-antitoxin stability system